MSKSDREHSARISRTNIREVLGVSSARKAAPATARADSKIRMATWFFRVVNYSYQL